MRYDYQTILNRFEASANPRFRALSDSIASRIMALLEGSGVPLDPPDPPTGLTATDDLESRIELNWAPVLGASMYIIERASVGSDDWQRVGDSVDSDWVDLGIDPDTTLRYRVRASNSAGVSDPSNVAVGSTSAGGGGGVPLPDEITGLTVDSNVGAVALSWDAFTGSTVAARLERSSDGGATWPLSFDRATTTAIDPTVLIGQTYMYRVAGLNSVGQVSNFSAPVSVTVVDGDTEAPPVPTLTRVDPLNKGLEVEWTGVVASDLAGYEIGWSTVSGVYDNVSPSLVTASQGIVSNLTNGVRVYVAVRSVDSSLNRNVSAWSNELSDIPIDLKLPTDPDPVPEPPTITSVTSPELNTIRVAFTPSPSEQVVRHRLYARVRGGQTLGNGQVPDGETWTQVDQELMPADVLGKDVTIFQGSLDYSFSPVEWEFEVRAVNTYSSESDGSNIAVGRPDGTDWAAGPGSGNVGSGNINGDTDLSPDHRVPGVMFDFVIDVSDASAYTETAMERAATLWNQRTTTPGESFIPLSVDDAVKVAVLLPAETVNKRLKLNMGATSNQVIEAADFNFLGSEGVVTQVELHFVAPWSNSPGLTLADAMLENRDDPTSVPRSYVRTLKDENNRALLPDLQGENIQVGNITKDYARGAFYFWGWGIEVAARTGVLLGGNADGGEEVTHDFDVIFGLCQFHQDNVLPNNVRVGQNAIDARFVRPSLLGCYIDMPWQQGDAIRALSPARGDWAIQDTRFARAGGAALNTYTRPVDAGLPEGTDPGALVIRGVRHWDEWPTVNDGIGRASRDGVYFFDLGGIEQDVTILDTEVIQENPSNFRGLDQWPPADPYDWRIFTDLVRMSHSALIMRHRAGTRARSDGWHHGELSVSSSLFYSKYPLRPIVDIDAAKSVTLADVGAFANDQEDIANVDQAGNSNALGESTLTAFRYCGSQTYPSSAPSAIGPLSATLLNSADQRNDLQSTYSISGANIFVSNQDIEFSPVVVDHFEITEDHSFDSFTPPASPFTQPVGLAPQWPTQPRIDAVAIYQQRNTQEENKLIRRPTLRNNRAPRDTVNIPWIQYREKFAESRGGTPNTAIVDPATEGLNWFFHDTTHDITLWLGRGSNPDGQYHTPEPVPPANLLLENDYRKVTFRNMFDNTSAGGHTMCNMPVYGFEDPGEGFETVRSSSDYCPIDGEIVMDNCGFDGQLDEEDRTWANRWYNSPKTSWINCDFENINKEHGCYQDLAHDAYMVGCTANHIGSQVVQWTSRAYNGGKPVDNEPVDYSPHAVIEDCHWVDVTGTDTYGTRPSYSMTLGNRGTSEFPGRVKVFDTSWVCGGGDEFCKAAYKPSTKSEHGRSFGPLVVSIEQGMQTLLDRNRTNRPNTATMVEWAWVKNCLFHAQYSVRSLLKFQSVDTIIIEDTGLINDRSTNPDNRWFRVPISIDSSNDAIENDPDFLGSRKLILRNVYCNGTGSPTDMSENTSFNNAHGYSRWGDDPNRQAGNIHCPGFQIEYDLRAGASSDPIYSGDYRPFTDIEGNALDLTTRFD